jgi:Resolvase, N terminal domain/Recombinase zinc beta ribbon domain
MLGTDVEEAGTLRCAEPLVALAFLRNSFILPAMENITLVPYARQSRSNETSISPERQLDDIAAWAERAGVALTEPVVERSVSGAKPWRERELGSVLATLESGSASGVAVAYFSRLTREKLSETFALLEALQPFYRATAERNRIVEPRAEIDLSDVIEGWQAHSQWSSLRKHLQRGKHEAWERGIFVGGAVAAGYSAPLGDRKNRAGKILTEALEPDPATLDSIARALSLRAGGASWGEVARMLTQAGVVTSRGSAIWTPGGAKALARNPIYRGLWRCTCGCGEERIRPELACVPAAVWRKAKPERSGTPGRKDGGTSLLAGLAKCETCGYAMSVQSTAGGRYRFYRCQGRTRCTAHASISQALAEDWVVGVAFAHAGMAAIVDDGKERKRLEQDLDAAQAELADVESVLGAKAPADSRQVQAVLLAEDALKALGFDPGRTRIVFALGQREGFETLTLAERKVALRGMISRVAVAPGRGHASERVVVEFH